MMVSVVFDASDESVLDMDNLIGLVGNTAFVVKHAFRVEKFIS